MSLTLEHIREVDPHGMYDLIRNFPEQWNEARALSQKIQLDITLGELEEVVVVGMGGSAIGGDLLRTFTWNQSPIPVLVVRSYTLPASVGLKTLVIASSYSGNTEETLAAFEEAYRRGSHVFCISSGGELLQRAEEYGVPYLRIPAGMPPRAALAYSLVPLLSIAHQVGFARIYEEDWDEAAEVLTRLAADFGDPSDNMALRIARALKDRLPIIYSSTGLLEAVNLRWRTQLNENAKTLAFGNLYPELNHNEIMGWEDTEWLVKRAAVITLRDKEDHPRVQLRMSIVREMLAHQVGFWAEIDTRGEGRLARMLSLVHLGDWVSLYLAVLRGVDPMLIRSIDRLKAALIEG